MSTPSHHRVLFVCMGNICRSPLAEGIFLHHANILRVADRFNVDSAGTGSWHVGERPDHRALAVAEKRGVKLVSRARQVEAADFSRFDLLVCMDEQNRRNLESLGAPDDRLHMMLDFHPQPPCRDVPDPYYGGDDGFDHVFDLLDESCRGLLDRLLR